MSATLYENAWGIIMTLSDWADVAAIVGSLVFVAIAIQIGVAYRQLKADHERSRREKSVELLMEWTQQIKKEGSVARKIIETFDPEQCRELVNQQEIKVAKKHKKLLSEFFKENNSDNSEGLKENCNDITLSESQSAELRWHAVSYLNSLESVLVAWQYSVVDREVIEQQFSYLFKPSDGHAALHDFRVAAGGEKSYPAIEIFSNHVEENRRKSLNMKAKVV